MSEIQDVPTEVTEIKNENVESKDTIPGYVTEGFLLVDPASYNPQGVLLNERCFVMPEVVVFGCMIQELPDSFLVALPMSIEVSSDGNSRGKLTPKTRIARFFKSQIESVILPSSQNLYFYRKALLDHLDIADDFLTPERVEAIQECVKAFEEEHPEDTKFNIGKELGLTSETSSAKVNWDMPSNASEKAFQYIWLEQSKH